jgi:hypothetical protein
VTRRQYSNTATPATLTGGISASDTSMTLTSFADYPPAPFTATIARGEVDEEVVLVTAVSASTVTVTRGYDGTTAKSHAAGATFLHTTIARDFDEANAHVNATTAVHGVSSQLVGTSDTQSLTNKTLVAPIISAPTVTGAAALASASLSGALTVTGASTLASASLSGTLGVTGNATVGGNLTVTGGLSAAGAVTLGPITFAAGQVGSFAAVTGTTGTFTGAVKGASLEATGPVILTQIATPAAPVNGKSNLYVASADDRLYWQSDAAGTVQTPTINWGSGGSFPATARTGDTFTHTTLGFLAYNGTAWRQLEPLTVASSAAQTTVQGTAGLYVGFRIYRSDLAQEYRWDGAAFQFTEGIFDSVSIGAGSLASQFADYSTISTQFLESLRLEKDPFGGVHFHGIVRVAQALGAGTYSVFTIPAAFRPASGNGPQMTRTCTYGAPGAWQQLQMIINTTTGVLSIGANSALALDSFLLFDSHWRYALT